MPNSTSIHPRSPDSAGFPLTGNMSGALRQLSRQLIVAGRFEEARQSIELSLELEPGQACCHLDLGNIYYASGRTEEAATEYRRLLELDPRSAEGWYNLGVVLMQQGKSPEAERACRRALRFEPKHARAHNNLAMLLQGAGKGADAARHYRIAASLATPFEEPRFNLGCLLQDQGRCEDAREVYEQLLATNPAHTEAANNLANVLVEMELYDEARARYLQTLEHRPDHALARWNLGLLELRAGNWAEGWRNYEWRLKQTPAPGWANRSLMPVWQGEALGDGQTLLLTAEQGMGDWIQFARFLGMARARAPRVWLECHPPLKPLFERLPGTAGVVAVGEPLPHHDCWLPMMSLPHVLGTTLETLPRAVPYLEPDPVKVAFWGERFRPWSGGLRGGVVWAGNSKYRLNQKRSVLGRDLKRLSRTLERHRQITWFSLQHGDAEGADFITFPDTPWTLDEIAAAIPNLDLVLTVDTSVAHLAGALGQQVLTMLPHHADWRWMGREHADSPWYPTMRLLRQKSAGDWESVFAQLDTALTHFCCDAGAGRPS